MAGAAKGKAGKLLHQRAGGSGPGGGGGGGGWMSWNRMPCALLLGVVSLVAILLTWRYSDRFRGFPRLWPPSFSDVEEGGETPPFVMEWHDRPVGITLLTHAVEEGAVCLDGSPPAYHFEEGTGDGANNWIVFLEGGGWCDSHESCLSRSFEQLGSSKYMPHKMLLTGALSGSPSGNPDFHNWNRVFVKYCDGGSFNSDVADPVDAFINNLVKGKVHYRGQRIWTAIMKDLLSKGMDKAEKAFLTGCSAGGLAAILHCDQFHDLLPKTSVKCLSDAGFFIDVPDVFGGQTIESLYANVVRVHGMAANLPKSCTSKRSETLCIFPEYLIADVKTPLFMLNPAYDTWQFANVLVPAWSDLRRAWEQCGSSLYLCTEAQMKTLQKFRSDFLEKLQPVLTSEKDGAYIDSCYLHCQAQPSILWGGPRVDGKSAVSAVGDWYFGRNTSKVIDCPFPCNPTCPF